MMFKALAILGGIGVGAALMYIFDPDDGRRRRALIRDKAVGLSNDAKRVIDKRSRDISNRAQGLVHDARSLISGGETAAETDSASARGI